MDVAVVAAAMAIADSWINDKAPNEQRGRILAVYSVFLGLASFLSQVFFLTIDSREDGFILTFALTMNLAVVLVALGTTKQPTLGESAPSYIRPLTFVSAPATAAAFTAGFCTTSLISILPFYLAEHDTHEDIVALAVGTIYLDRLLCQWPLWMLSDHMERRSLLLTISAVVMAVLMIGMLFKGGDGQNIGGDRGVIVQVAAFLMLFILGGSLYPMYSVGAALAFDRAEGHSLMDISTTMLIMNSICAILGALVVMLPGGTFGDQALSAAVITGCAAVAATCVMGKAIRPPAETPTAAVNVMAGQSVEMAESAAEIAEEELSESQLELQENLEETDSETRGRAWKNRNRAA